MKARVLAREPRLVGSNQSYFQCSKIAGASTTHHLVQKYRLSCCLGYTETDKLYPISSSLLVLLIEHRRNSLNCLVVKQKIIQPKFPRQALFHGLVSSTFRIKHGASLGRSLLPPGRNASPPQDTQHI